MIPTPSRTALDDAAREARDRYLSRVPPPLPEDFPCRWCLAPVGRPCRRLDRLHGAHRPRADRWGRAYDRWVSGAIEAEDRAVNVLCALADLFAA